MVTVVAFPGAQTERQGTVRFTTGTAPITSPVAISTDDEGRIATENQEKLENKREMR